MYKTYVLSMPYLFQNIYFLFLKQRMIMISVFQHIKAYLIVNYKYLSVSLLDTIKTLKCLYTYRPFDHCLLITGLRPKIGSQIFFNWSPKS